MSANTGPVWAGNTPNCLNGVPPGSVFAANNRLLGSSYDNAGNQTVVNGNTLTYDSENRVTQVVESSGTETLAYDGSGQRVMKTQPSGTTVYVYDAFGQLAAEYGPTTPNPGCTTCYLGWDHLGSTRLLMDQNGNVVARHDYLPFGEEIPANQAGRTNQWGSTTDVTQKFTGQVRDQETGMDYFNARYFVAPLGRFTSTDPDSGNFDVTNPQAFNRYAYVLNNPLAFTDPTGADICPDGTYASVCVVDSGPDPIPVDDCWFCFSGGGGTPQPPPQPQPPPLITEIQDLLVKAGNWLKAPRDPNCMLQATAKGGAIGTGIGLVGAGIAGLESGPGAVPTAYRGLSFSDLPVLQQSMRLDLSRV